jgi:hypothetical protein
MLAGLEIKLDNLRKVLGSIETLTSHDVYVGFPAEHDTPREPYDLPKGSKGLPPEEPKVTNALIAFVQEHGSPALNIPARPFMIPGVRSIRDRSIQMLKKAALLGLEGKKQSSLDMLNALGMVGVSAVQRAITVGAGWAPLAELTLERRRARGVRRTHPLLDSGQLRAHVTYVVRKKQGHATLFIGNPTQSRG